jgi:YidC/Oxa1 family membrane protein insertase
MPSPAFGAGFFGIDHFMPPWDVFYLPLFNLLVGFYHLLFSDFALAIIVFTIVVRTILAPLFIQQIRSQKEMQRMQPLVREIQRKHKGNRQKITEETMALYREHGVNQFGGCLPLILQLPLLYALYQALIRASNVVTLTADQVKSADFTTLQAALPGIKQIGTQGTSVLFQAPLDGACNLSQFDGGAFTHFLPINCQLIDPLHLGAQIGTKVPWLLNLDLAKPDTTLALVIGGFGLSALAVIAAILQFVQVKMTSPAPNPDDPTSGATSTMTYLFPLLTVVWGGLFPSGLILYWVVYTAYLVIQQYFIMGWGNLFPVFGWSPSFARTGGTDAGPPGRRDARPGSGASGPSQPSEPPAAGQRAQGQKVQSGQRPGERRPGVPQRAGGQQRPSGQKKRGRKR